MARWPTQLQFRTNCTRLKRPSKDGPKRHPNSCYCTVVQADLKLAGDAPMLEGIFSSRPWRDGYLAYRGTFSYRKHHSHQNLQHKEGRLSQQLIGICAMQSASVRATHASEAMTIKPSALGNTHVKQVLIPAHSGRQLTIRGWRQSSGCGAKRSALA